MQFVLVRAGGAASQDALDGVAHAHVAVTQQGRAVAATEIDVFPAIQIPDAAAFRSVHEHRMSQGAIEARRGAHAPRQVLASLLILLLDSAHEVPASASQGNPKLEIRKNAQITISKMPNLSPSCFVFFDFFICSSFGFRISDFGFPARQCAVVR